MHRAWLPFGLAVGTATLALGMTLPVPPPPKPTAVVSITDEVTATGFPGRIQDRATLATKQIIVLTRYQNLPLGKHWYRCEIYDGSGRRVELNGMNLDVNSPSYWTSTPYSPNRYDDAPGTWQAVIFIDGIELVRQSIEVDPVPPITKRLSLGLGSDNFSKSNRLGGGNYFYADAEWEFVPGISGGVRWSTQLLPDPFADELLSFSASAFVGGRNSLYSAYSLLYANSARHLDRGMVGFEVDLVDSGDSSSPRFALLPFRVYFDIENSQVAFSYELLRFMLKI